MEIYNTQATEKEMESIGLILDSIRSAITKNSPYQKDVANVTLFLNRTQKLFKTEDLLKLCRELMERNELSLEGFKAIRAIVRDANNENL